MGERKLQNVSSPLSVLLCVCLIRTAGKNRHQFSSGWFCQHVFLCLLLASTEPVFLTTSKHFIFLQLAPGTKDKKKRKKVLNKLKVLTILCGLSTPFHIVTVSYTAGTLKPGCIAGGCLKAGLSNRTQSSCLTLLSCFEEAEVINYLLLFVSLTEQPIKPTFQHIHFEFTRQN